MSKVKVLYDFTAESANEVTTFVGEELTVLDPNSYEGWLKIRNIRGEEGIVPSAYVEFMEDDDIPPPPSSNNVVIPDSWTGSASSANTSQTPAYMNASAFDSNPSSYQNSYQNNYNSNHETNETDPTSTNPESNPNPNPTGPELSSEGPLEPEASTEPVGTNTPDVNEIEQDAQLDPATVLNSELTITDPLADLEALTTSYIELIAPDNEGEESAQSNQAYAGQEEANEYARNSTGFADNSAYQSQPEAEPTAAATSWDNPPAVAAANSWSTPAAAAAPAPASSWDNPPAALEKPQEKPNVPESKPVGEATPTSWDNPAPSHNPPSYSNNASTTHYSDSDDFDEDDKPSRPAAPGVKTIGRSGSDSFSVADRNSTMSASHSITALNKHKNKNSFGLDTFLLCGAVKAVLDSEKQSTIVLNDYRQSLWKRRCPPYSISIINHHIDKKYHGVKSFVSYEIQTEKFPQRVRRRYNHFDWLHDRLEEKYPNICIPPLPDKALKGNFEEDFIMKRKSKLELWLNRLSSHPVISESEVFIHFLQCDDTSAKWKAGKRAAEHDQYRGSQWFCTLTVPNESTDTMTSIKERVDKFAKASHFLDFTVKNVCQALDKVAGLHQLTYKKEMNNLGKRFEELGTALSAESLDAQNNNILSRAIVTCGNNYNQIGNSYGEQPKDDIGPLLDRLVLYRGIIQQMPEIVQFEKNAIQTYEEYQAKPDKLLGKNLMDVAPRREVVSHVTFAEINQFNKEKVEDITICMKTFLKKQIEFYTEITETLKKSLAGLEQIPVTKKF